MQKAIIVDDEILAANILKNLLKPNSQIEVIGVYHNIESAANGITKLQPDLVLLDVELGGETAFDLLGQLKHINFDIIFTTAYDKYAIKAFKFSAMAYLTKPIDPEELNMALERSLNHFTVKDISNKLKSIFNTIDYNYHHPKKLAIPTTEGISLIEVDHIIRCQSDSNYTYVHMVNNEKHLVTKPLKEIEELLSDQHFFRIHQSHLINLDYAVKYYKGKGGYVKMRDGTNVEVAVRRKEELIKNLLGR